MVKFDRLRLLPFGSVLFLLGCTSTHTLVETPQPVFEASEQFLPVNVQTNLGLSVREYSSQDVRIFKTALIESSAFQSINQMPLDWPYKLSVQILRKSTDDLADSTGQLVSAATLFIVPSSVKTYVELLVQVKADEEVCASYQYSDNVDTRVSLTTNADELDDVVIRNLVYHFLNDLIGDSPIPLAAEFDGGSVGAGCSF